MITRRQLPDGTTELAAGGVRFTFKRLRPGALLMTIHGDDRDELGAAPFKELESELARHTPLELLIDTSDSSGTVSSVREAWTEWLKNNRPRLKRVSILASTRYVNVTIGVAKLFSRTGDLIQIYSDRALFDQALAVAAGRVV